MEYIKSVRETYEVEGESRQVDPAYDQLLYSGRIDDSDPHRPVFVQPGSFVRMQFTGSSWVRAIVINHRRCKDSWVGVLLDKHQSKVKIEIDDEPVVLILAEDLDRDLTHELTFFKRMDQCHSYTFLGFLIEDGARVQIPRRLPRKEIEFYGDSVTAGAASEAVHNERQPDPENNGEYDNAYFSFAWATARRLHAGAQLVAQSGIAAVNGYGYLDTEDGVLGMESCYDRVYFYPEHESAKADPGSAQMETVNESEKRWNFERFRPQVVVSAVGQNDAYPEDFMKEDPYGKKAADWMKHYAGFVRNLRRAYPNAWIILMTTISYHHPGWDRAIGRVCTEINDPKIVHFLFDENGRGTPENPRVTDAMDMALELAGFIEGLSDRVWD